MGSSVPINNFSDCNNDRFFEFGDFEENTCNTYCYEYNMHNFSKSLIPNCIEPQVLNNDTMECELIIAPAYPTLTESGQISDIPDGYYYYYDDGSKQFCSTSSGTCATYDAAGNKIDNIPIDGVMYNTLLENELKRWVQIGSTVLSVAGGTALVVGTAGMGSMAGLALSTGFHTGLTASFYGNQFTQEVGLASIPGESLMQVDLTKMSFSSQSDGVSNTTDAQGVKEIITLPAVTITSEPTPDNDFNSQNNLEQFEYTVYALAISLIVLSPSKTSKTNFALNSAL